MSIGDRVKVWLQTHLSDFPPEWLNDRDRLQSWAEAHADPARNVWAITIIRNEAGWLWGLWEPGTDHTLALHPDGDLREPAATRWPVYDEDGNDIGTRLDGNDFWMKPWVEEVAGRPVRSEMIDGLLWYGPGPVDYQYVIYAQVGRPAMLHPQLQEFLDSSGEDRGAPYDLYVFPNGYRVMVFDYGDACGYGARVSARPYEDVALESISQRPLEEIHDYLDRVADLPEVTRWPGYPAE